MQKYITMEKLNKIHNKFKELLNKPNKDLSFGLYREKVDASYTWIKDMPKAKFSRYKSFYDDLINLTPKDVVNENNIPCYNISDIDIDNIENTPIKMYIDIPQSLKNDSYTYFGVFLNYDLKSMRYNYGDIVIIRKGESFALDEYNDELLILRNGELTFSTFSYAYENHESILYIKDTDDNEWYNLKANEMYIYKIIGTVVAILPRIIQDNKEKNNGIFNRKLQTLSSLQED